MSRLVLVPLLGLATFAPLLDTLRFVPREGSELRITVERDVDAKLVTSEMTIDGAAHAGSQPPEMSFELSSKLVFLDRWESVTGGRVTHFERTYEELTEERFETIRERDGDDEQTLEAESDLEGRTVVFLWDDDNQAHVAELADDGTDRDLLEGLVAEVDLRAFLPEDDVDEGDAWDVPVAALVDVIAPGGDLQLVLDGTSGIPDVPLAAELDGEIRATLRGEREQDGLDVRVIALVVEVEAEVEAELDEGGEETRTLEYELEGELLWLPEEGRFHALELRGELTWTIVQRRTVTMGDRDFDTERTTTLVGDAEYALSAESE